MVLAEIKESLKSYIYTLSKYHEVSKELMFDPTIKITMTLV